MNVDHSTFRYNTQDGLDAGHVDTGNFTLSFTNSNSYGNMGGQLKWGPNFQTVTVANNTFLSNCLRMSQPMTSQPSTYNANLVDFCRANDAISFAFRQGGTTTIENNSIASYSPTTFDIQCWDARGAGSPGDTGTGCGNSSLIMKNNIVLGYDNPTTYNQGGQQGGPGLYYFRDPIGTVTRMNNIYFGIRGSTNCQTSELCVDPLFVSEPVFTGESSLDNFSFHLAPTSPAIKAGVLINSIITDLNGVTRPNPPSIGALEP